MAGEKVPEPTDDFETNAMVGFKMSMEVLLACGVALPVIHML